MGKIRWWKIELNAKLLNLFITKIDWALTN